VLSPWLACQAHAAPAGFGRWQEGPPEEMCFGVSKGGADFGGNYCPGPVRILARGKHGLLIYTVE